MKPRIKLVKVIYDCGHRYELWLCKSFGITGFSAYGDNPSAAYKNWKGCQQ